MAMSLEYQSNSRDYVDTRTPLAILQEVIARRSYKADFQFSEPQGTDDTRRFECKIMIVLPDGQPWEGNTI